VGGDPDDAVALLAAWGHPDVDLVGVSTVSGNLEWRAGEARRVLGRRAAGIEIVAGPPPAGALRGVDLLLAIGPLTNVAQLARDGALPGRVGCMAATLHPVEHRGALVRVDYNVSVDPHAASDVLDRVDGLVVTPLDITVRVRCDAAQETNLREHAPAIGEQLDRFRRHRGDGPLFLHDPLALLALLGEPAVRTERATLRVDEMGMTSRAEGERHEVVVDVDAPAAATRILELALAT
jgi:inosine-uridine nucleoside N-ribohydrolase